MRNGAVCFRLIVLMKFKQLRDGNALRTYLIQCHVNKTFFSMRVDISATQLRPTKELCTFVKRSPAPSQLFILLKNLSRRDLEPHGVRFLLGLELAVQT